MPWRTAMVRDWRTADVGSFWDVTKDTPLETATPKEDIVGVLKRIWFCLTRSHVRLEFCKIFSNRKEKRFFTFSSKNNSIYYCFSTQAGVFYMVLADSKRKNLSWLLLVSQHDSKDCQLQTGMTEILLQKIQNPGQKSQTEIHLRFKENKKSEIPC